VVPFKEKWGTEGKPKASGDQWILKGALRRGQWGWEV
jgi:hypothetical protein